jgi:hypothetical protein
MATGWLIVTSVFEDTPANLDNFSTSTSTSTSSFYSSNRFDQIAMAADFSWRCNILECREPILQQAVVTTCRYARARTNPNPFRLLILQSHILCLPCAEKTGLSAPSDGVRQCPACGVRLMNQDDAVITQLDPSEDYKTSVLSGLTPTIIMECAGRGLSFYSYQVNQEMSALFVFYTK